MAKSRTAPAEPKRTVADVDGEIVRHSNDFQAVEAEIGRLRSARPALLLDLSEAGETRIEEHDIAVARASRRAERLGAVLGQLRAEREALATAEEQGRRRTLYAAGKAAEAEYRRLLSEDYVVAAQALAEVLARLVAQDAAIDDANRQRPEGAPAIDLTVVKYGPDRRRVTSLDHMIVLPGPGIGDPWIWDKGLRT